MSYPNYPENRLIVGGVDLSVRYQLILLDGYTLSPPEPKTYTVDVPGGDGVIDLTQALTGDVAYSNRNQEFTFLVVDTENFEKVKTEVSNFLHGKAFDYNMTMDPEYTYHGRFTVTDYQHQSTANHGIVGAIKVKVSAEPYKLKGHKAYALNATGGAMFRLPSGRKPVHPIIETAQPCHVRFGDVITEVPAGTYRLNDILFEEGFNNIYINSYRFYNITWDDLKTIQYKLPVEDNDQHVNLIQNPSFEYGDFHYWTVDSGWASSAVDTDDPCDGMYKAKFKTPCSAGSSIKSSSFESLENHVYDLSGMVYSDNDVTLAFGLYAGGVDDYVYYTNEVTVTGGEWQPISTTITVNKTSPDTRLTIGVVSSIESPSVIRFDDFKVVDSTQNIKTGMTWADASKFRWDDIQRLEGNKQDVPRKWDELHKFRWNDLAKSKWKDLDFRTEDVPDTTVYVKYDWKDL